MMKSRNFFRLVVPCLALAGIVLALASYHWPSPVRAGQDPAQQRRQKSRPPQPTFSTPSSPDAPAATITVNTLVDENNTGANCSLREAIMAANTNAAFGGCSAGSGADIINVTVTGTIQLTGVLPDIADNLTINGPAANLLTVRRDTGGNYNIFLVDVGITAAFQGLTISNGLGTNVA